MNPHPTKPLHVECIREMAQATTAEQITEILNRYDKRRDEEFPGWRDEYERKFKEWCAQV